MYVIQIKQRILRPDGTPRMAPIIMNYSLGDFTDLAFLYKHTPELIRFFTNCQILGIVPLDSLQPAEQEALKGHLKIAKERPEFPQYQILQYLEAMAQAEKQTTPARKRESAPKEERHKSTADDIQEAMRLLKERLKDSKTPDWEIPTIEQYLKDKMGYCPEISPKTKLGKYWAILYSHRKRTLPKKWDVDMVKKAKKELESDGVSFEFLL